MNSDDEYQLAAKYLRDIEQDIMQGNWDGAENGAYLLHQLLLAAANRAPGVSPPAESSEENHGGHRWKSGLEEKPDGSSQWKRDNGW